MSNRTIRVAGPALALALALMVAAIVVAGPGLRAEVVVERQGSLVGPAFTAGPSDQGRVTVANLGPNPARVRILFLRATDFERLGGSPFTVVQPGSSLVLDRQMVFIPDDFPVMVVVRFVARDGPTDLRASLQIADASGVTRIFTDGFESGDVSA